MLYCLIIIFAIFVLALSISNPLFKIITRGKFKKFDLYQFFIRFFLFVISIILIFLGLYVESLS